MKKKILIVGLFTLLMAGCNVFGGGEKEDVYCTVTFKQEAEQDIIRQVKYGQDLTDIPTPNEKTGYTVKWDREDFANIIEDLIVNAVNTANKYTITYSAEGFDIDGTTVELTYDSPCSNLDMSLTKDDANLVGWKYNDVTYTTESIWNVANNVTIVASWEEKEQFTVTFIDSDGTSIVKTVYEGQDLTDIPTPTPVTGYTVSWDRTDFTNIVENITVNVVKTSKTYTVTFDPNGGSLQTTSVTVAFGQPYTFEKAVHLESQFVAWKYGNQRIPLSGTWNIDVENGTINLVAEWGESEWTEFY